MSPVPCAQGSACLQPPCQPVPPAVRNSIGCKQRPRPARSPKGVRVAQGPGDPRLSRLLLGPQAPRPGQLLSAVCSWPPPPPQPLQPKKGGAGAAGAPLGPVLPHRVGCAPWPAPVPSERSLAVPAAPATSSRQAAACRAASNPRPERPPSPAQGRSCQPRGPAGTLGAGRARTVAALPCSGPCPRPLGLGARWGWRGLVLSALRNVLWENAEAIIPSYFPWLTPRYSAGRSHSQAPAPRWTVGSWGSERV